MTILKSNNTVYGVLVCLNTALNTARLGGGGGGCNRSGPSRQLVTVWCPEAGTPFTRGFGWVWIQRTRQGRSAGS